MIRQRPALGAWDAPPVTRADLLALISEHRGRVVAEAFRRALQRQESPR